MSIPLSHANASAKNVDAPTRAKALILRSCRPQQFADAVRTLRSRSPDVEVVALSHRGHADALRSSGVDRTVEVPGRRFGLLRTSPYTLVALRAERFDEVVIPQMTGVDHAHANLYWLAAATGAGRVVILSGDAEPRSCGRRELLRLLLKPSFANLPLRSLIARLDIPVFLGLLAVSRVAPRTARRGDEGRRRVLHIISSLGVGGAQRQLAELVNRTRRDRYDVEVLVLGRSDGEFSRAWLPPDVPVTFLESWPRLAASVMEVRRRCREGQYDLVHTWLFMANVIGAPGARLAGVRGVITSVRNLSLWKRTWYRQWWFRAADILCARAADVVTVNAEALVADHAAWARVSARRIDVVHNGLDPSHFLVETKEARRYVRQAAGLTDAAIVIGTAGRLAPEKDHLRFLRIVRGVRQVRPDTRAVVIGDGALRAQLEAAALEMGLEDAVVFLGERHDARRLIAGLDLFVLSSAIEGFPNALLEAVFLGVPAIASRVGGSPDVLADSDVTFEVDRDGDAVDAAVRALTDPRRAAERAERLRSRALDLFTANRTAAAWCALYDRCLTEETR